MLDVTDAGRSPPPLKRIGAEVGTAGLDGLVNNAGIAVPGPLETLPIDDFRRQIEVNLTAQVAVTQAMLPAIRTARGRIVFITSIGGLMAFPMFGAYHAAKFGLEAVGDVFRQELRPWGIEVVDRRARLDRDADLGARRGGSRRDRRRAPATARSELYGEAIDAYREVARKTGERGIPPEKVAARIEHALSARRPRTRYLVGADARGQALCLPRPARPPRRPARRPRNRDVVGPNARPRRSSSRASSIPSRLVIAPVRSATAAASSRASRAPPRPGRGAGRAQAPAGPAAATRACPARGRGRWPTRPARSPPRPGRPRSALRPAAPARQASISSPPSIASR